MASIPNIEYKGNFSKCVGARDDKLDFITFYKPKEYFYTSENYTSFIKTFKKFFHLSGNYGRLYLPDTCHTICGHS